MKKIPTLFERTYDEKGRIIGITDNPKKGLEWVLAGEGYATIKVDGSCCAIIDGKFYKRYDAKNGKPVPEGAIKCQEEADPITGHLPCWVECSRDNPADKWFFKAYDEMIASGYGYSDNHTYEAIGPHFQSNPYNLEKDTLFEHGCGASIIENLPRTFESIKEFLKNTPIEGIVFWKDNIPQCKIKRSDFGFKWPCEGAYYRNE